MKTKKASIRRKNKEIKAKVWKKESQTEETNENGENHITQM